MQRDKLSGGALILGALAAITTMVFHPSGGDLAASGDGAAHLSRVAVVTHALALASFPVSFLGAIGLSRHLSRDGVLTLAPLVVYAMALVAAISATVASGLVGSEIAQRMAAAEGTRYEALSALFLYTGLLNRAFAGVFIVASSAAVLLWSAEILARGTFPLWMGAAGAVISSLSLLAYLPGHVRLDVHGFGMLVFAQSAWFIAAGVALIRGSTDPGRRRSSPPSGPVQSIAAE